MRCLSCSWKFLHHNAFTYLQCLGKDYVCSSSSRKEMKSSHRMTEQLRLEGASGGCLVHAPPAQARPSTAACPGLCPDVF